MLLKYEESFYSVLFIFFPNLDVVGLIIYKTCVCVCMHVLGWRWDRIMEVEEERGGKKSLSFWK